MKEELKNQLTELGLNEEQIEKLAVEGVKEAADMQILSGDDVKLFTGCGLITARKVATAFTPAAPVSEAAMSQMAAAALDVLPIVPTDDVWMNSLRVGGVMKFNASTVVGTMSAGLAAKVGLFELPSKIGAAMEKLAQSLEEPVGDDYYQMQTLLTRRSYADIFAALPGVDGRFATQARKDALLRKVDERLWTSLTSFHHQLEQWAKAWQQNVSMTGPAMMANAVASLVSGGSRVTPPGMMQVPPTDVLHDAADSVVNDINYVFAGTGIPVAMALAYDAQQIRKVLENPALPAQVGAANREQMLRMLGVAVSSDYPRLERSLKQYALSVIELKNVTPGDSEYAYINALFQLGTQIPWDKLSETGAGGRASIGSVRSQL